MWSVTLSNGDVAVVVANMGLLKKRGYELKLADAGLAAGHYEMVDLWSGAKKNVTEGRVLLGDMARYGSFALRFRAVEAHYAGQ